MKKIPAAIAILTLLLAACVADPPLEGGDGHATSQSAEVSQARIIEVSAANWKFSPTTIAVKKGEKVMIRLTSTEGRHGFAVPDLGINTAVSPGKTVDVELPTDSAGEFSFRCSVPCGPGHEGMTGTISITD